MVPVGFPSTEEEEEEEESDKGLRSFPQAGGEGHAAEMNLLEMNTRDGCDDAGDSRMYEYSCSPREKNG